MSFIEKVFDREFYLKNNPDVKKAGIDPVEHWLNYGMLEGRLIAPFINVLHGPVSNRLKGLGWLHFSWKGSSVAVRVRKSRPAIVAQILEQAEFDVEILAAGAKSIENLKHYYSTDLIARDGVDVPAIFESLPVLPGTVIITPFLCVGGAEKYVADLAGVLSETLAGPVLVVVTTDTAQTCKDWEQLSILAPLKHKNIIFWRDLCVSGYANPAVLARFLNALRPKRIIVNNSRVGYEAIASYGRGLSQYAKIFCTFFSLKADGLDATYSARFPRKVLPFAKALTDNIRMADTLRRMWGGITGPGIAELPAKLTVMDNCVFRARLENRLALDATPKRCRRWLWVSRIEPFKGTAILSELARLRPADSFELFGSVQGENIASQGLEACNILYRGVLTNIATEDFSSYDGFVFTSYFEGMPNVVLEMSQHAIPLVLADVGGLRGTFDDNAAKFVAHRSEVSDTAQAFSGVLDDICRMNHVEIERMVTAAYDQAFARHSPEDYIKNVKGVFEI